MKAETVQMVRDWADISVILGAPCIRVFAGGGLSNSFSSPSIIGSAYT